MKRSLFLISIMYKNEGGREDFNVAADSIEEATKYILSLYEIARIEMIKYLGDVYYV